MVADLAAPVTVSLSTLVTVRLAALVEDVSVATPEFDVDHE